MIEERFRRHRHAEIILSMPGFGIILGAEFLAATGRDMSAFDSADRLASADSHRYGVTSGASAATSNLTWLRIRGSV
jgi:transposase